MIDLEYLEGKTLSELKDIADELGVEFAKNIGKTKLLDKIVEDDKQVDGVPASIEGIKVKKKETVAEMKKRMNKLIRVRISSSSPHYKGRNGVTKQVGNSRVMVGKFVPFNKIWHVQEPILNRLRKEIWRETKFVTDRTTGNKVPVVNVHPAFNIEVLPQLTAKELKKLASEQATRGSIPTEEEIGNG